MKLKVAIYAKVSTKDQKPDSQLRDSKRYSKESGYQVYTDVGVSGAKDKATVTL